MALNVNIGIGPILYFMPICLVLEEYINAHVLRVCWRLDQFNGVIRSSQHCGSKVLPEW